MSTTESTPELRRRHSASLLWNSTTWEISEALMPFLRTTMEGPTSWAESDTIDRAIEIEDGHIRNEAILTFQGRSADYPHVPTDAPV